MGNKHPVFIYKGFFLLLPLLCYAHCFPSALMQRTEYQVPNQNLKQIFKLVPDSANRLLLIEMRLILGLGLANLMAKRCTAHLGTLQGCSPGVSRAAAKPPRLQISAGEPGPATCVCAAPRSRTTANPAPPPPGAWKPARPLHVQKRAGLGKAGLETSPGHTKSPSPSLAPAKGTKHQVRPLPGCREPGWSPRGRLPPR